MIIHFFSDVVDGSQIETDICKIIKYKDLYCELDFSFKILYSFVGENREYNINDFTFLSLIEIKNKFNKYIYFMMLS